MILGGHKKQKDSVKKLEATQGHDAHEEEDTVEDGHGDESQDGSHQHTEAGEDGDHQGGQSLLSYSEELRLLARNGCGALFDEGLDVIDGGDGVGDEPGQTKDRGDDDNYCQHQKIQVISATFIQPGR